jgi:hypothetical protein
MLQVVSDCSTYGKYVFGAKDCFPLRNLNSLRLMTYWSTNKGAEMSLTALPLLLLEECKFVSGNSASIQHIMVFTKKKNIFCL